MGPRARVAAACAVAVALACTPVAARDAGAAPTCKMEAFTPEQAARYAELVATLRAGTLERRELRDGWAFRLVGDEAHFLQAAEWIALERRCCSFFRFELTWAGDRAPLWVRVRGSRAAKQLLADAWDLQPGPSKPS